jgi:hypothetical protein
MENFIPAVTPSLPRKNHSCAEPCPRFGATGICESNRIVIPTEAKRSGGTCCFSKPQPVPLGHHQPLESTPAFYPPVQFRSRPGSKFAHKKPLCLLQLEVQIPKNEPKIWNFKRCFPSPTLGAPFKPAFGLSGIPPMLTAKCIGTNRVQSSYMKEQPRRACPEPVEWGRLRMSQDVILGAMFSMQMSRRLTPIKKRTAPQTAVAASRQTFRREYPLFGH